MLIPGELHDSLVWDWIWLELFRKLIIFTVIIGQVNLLLKIQDSKLFEAFVSGDGDLVLPVFSLFADEPVAWDVEKVLLFHEGFRICGINVRFYLVIDMFFNVFYVVELLICSFCYQFFKIDILEGQNPLIITRSCFSLLFVFTFFRAITFFNGIFCEGKD